MQTLPRTFPSFFIHMIRPYMLELFFYMSAAVVWGANMSLLPYQLKKVIDTIADRSIAPANVTEAITTPILIYLGLFILQSVLFRVRDWMRLRVQPAIRKDIIMAMFAYLQHHSHQFFQQRFSGSLSNKINDMHRGVADIITYVDDILSQVFGICLAVIILWITNPIFTALFAGWATIFIFVTWFYTKRMKKLANDYSESNSKLSGFIVDSIANMIHVRLFASQAHELATTERQADDFVTKNRAGQLNLFHMNIYQTILTVMLTSAMFYVLTVLYQKGQVTAGDFALIITICMSVAQSLWWVMGEMNQLAEQYGVCSQALSILNEPHQIVDKDNASTLQVPKGEIRCNKLTFSYENQADLFHDFNLTIEAGQKIGLVGFSGSGKSSFVNLLLRFYDIHSGAIEIDGQNIADVTQDSLRSNIAMIPQDPSLFHRTLMDNIRYGRLTATDEEVLEASKRAHCHDFIMNIPGQYDALVGERGIKLSGGQRQRIAIARAILKNAPILILDEATSSLDSITEGMIQQSLDELMADRTTIVIAHRLSTLSKMDRLVVFHEGAVIEDGNHETLLKAGGHYARMWNMQAGGFLPEKETDDEDDKR